MENLQNKSPLLGKESFWGGAGASFNGFIDFCKRNTPLVITVTLAAIFVYGVILFNFAVIGDNVSILDKPGFMEYESSIPLGRWTTKPIQKLFFVKGAGMYAANFISVLSIWLFSLLFCYFIAVFTKNTERRNGFIPLALIVLSYSVWPQYFQDFTFNAIRTVFICLTLINVYLLFDGFLTRNKLKTAVGFVLSVFTFGEYEPLVVLFLCITFIYFVLLCENSNLPSKDYVLLCLKLFIAFIAAFALTTVIGKIVKSALALHDSDYVTRHMVWNKAAVKTIIAGILAQIYVLTIGAIPFVHSIFAPMMPAMYGSGADPFNRPIADTVLSVSQSVGNIFLLPAVILFLVIIFINAKKRIPAGRRLLYVLAGFGIPVSILFLVLVSGEVIGTRILYALPFAAAFMFYYVSYRQKTVLRRVFYCLVLGSAFYQAQISQSLLEASVRLGEMDAKIAFDLDARTRGILENGKKLPVVFIGNINHPFDRQIFRANEAGRSAFESWLPADKGFLSERVLTLMNVYGFTYDIPSPEQAERAYELSRDMPSYPENGCMKNLGDVIVIKMGD